MEIKVECQADYRGEEEPLAFYMGNRRVDVMIILDRWLDPHHRYFKVQAYDTAVFILRQDEQSGSWEMKWFNARA